MKHYIGIKEINAKPMNRLDYNNSRGWKLPADENGADEGYLVEYIDGGQANTKEYKGYVSWSPEDVFERAYKPTDGMTFGLAIEALKKGYKVARKGWNGKNLWLVLQEETPEVELREGSVYKKAGLDRVKIDAHIDMKTAQGTMQPGWLASQADMLSQDWEIKD